MLPGKRVLVVEDEALIQILVADMVLELGHQVAAIAANVDAALSVVRRDRPDLVLLDVNIGGQLSYEVANHCTVEGIPVVLTTGYSASDIPEGLKHCPVLSKPFSTDQLRAAIGAALA